MKQSELAGLSDTKINLVLEATNQTLPTAPKDMYIYQALELAQDILKKEVTRRELSESPERLMMMRVI